MTLYTPIHPYTPLYTYKAMNPINPINLMNTKNPMNPINPINLINAKLQNPEPPKPLTLNRKPTLDPKPYNPITLETLQSYKPYYQLLWSPHFPRSLGEVALRQRPPRSVAKLRAGEGRQLWGAFFMWGTPVIIRFRVWGLGFNGLYRGYIGFNGSCYASGWLAKLWYPLGLYWGSMGDNGKENGNYYSIIGIILGWLSKLWPLFGYPKY